LAQRGPTKEFGGKFGDGDRCEKNDKLRPMVVLAASAAERADENVGGAGTPPLSHLELGARHSALIRLDCLIRHTPVTMRDALAEAARLREENLKILQVMQWGQQQLSKTITFGGVTKWKSR
jgi:hypothetical protein